MFVYKKKEKKKVIVINENSVNIYIYNFFFYLGFDVAKRDAFYIWIVDRDVYIELHVCCSAIEIKLRSALNSTKFNGRFLEDSSQYTHHNPQSNDDQ